MLAAFMMITHSNILILPKGADLVAALSVRPLPCPVNNFNTTVGI